MAAPVPTHLFHITAIANLAAIASSGALLSKERLTADGLNPTNIAYETIQDRRARTMVPIAPGGTLHHYVPFHFAPRSPMLMTIDKGNVPGCDLTQNDIVYLTTTAQIIANQGAPFVFTDYHAVMAIASFFSDLNDLNQINWSIFFEHPLLGGYCKYWQNRSTPAHMMRMETRQAEFLVRDTVPLAVITQIGVKSRKMAGQVQMALANTGWNPPIQIVPGWYY